MSRIFNEINTRSDFVIVLAMDGGIPSCDFDGRVISGYTQYPFGRKSSEYTHCMERVPPHEEGTTANQELLILCDRHGLASGTVTVEIAWHIPDPLFPDGYRDELRRYDPHIRLSATASGDVDMVRVEAQLPLYKGDKGDKGDKLTYADLTVQDKEDLIGPIKDDLDKAMTDKADKTELSNIVGVPSDGNIEDLDPTFITTALRKTAQVLTLEEQAQVKANLGISKMELFKDIWLAATFGYWHSNGGPEQCGGINEKGPYIYDMPLTYEEALDILSLGYPNMADDQLVNRFAQARTRTHLPQKNGAANLSAKGSQTFWNSQVEKVVMPNMDANYFCFYNCAAKSILVRSINTNSQMVTRNLVSLRLKCPDNTMSNGGYDFRWNPLMDLDSFKEMVRAINGAKGSSTLTVHPDVYAKLTDETNTEWHALMTKAADQNIIFATV